MKIGITIVLVIGMITGQSAYAKSPFEYDAGLTRCTSADDDSIDMLLSMIEYVDKQLSSVPPEQEQEHNLDTEYTRASKFFDDAMLNKEPTIKSHNLYYQLSLRPYYDVWHLRRDIEPSGSALKRILKSQSNLQKGDHDFLIYKKIQKRKSFSVHLIQCFTPLNLQEN